MAGETSEIAIEPELSHAEYGQEQGRAFESEIASYTTSLASDVTNYKYEHGRRYHAYKEGSYMLPNDEKEIDRLDILHKLIMVTRDGKLVKAPIAKNPQRILDIGTGTGIWAIEMGDEYPNAEILGNDLSAIQPRWVPQNVRFEIDDVEADWTYGAKKFDYIHCRSMAISIRDWPRLVKQCFQHVKPGGWLEMVDLDLEYTSPDGSLTEDSFCRRVNKNYLDAMRKSGTEPCPGPRLEGWMREAGFVDLHHEKFHMPCGTWPLDERLKEIGAWNYLQMIEGLEAFHTAVFTRVLGWSVEEVAAMNEGMKRELRGPKMHLMFDLHVCYGRKPEVDVSEKESRGL